jgi:hypothetical protein
MEDPERLVRAEDRRKRATLRRTNLSDSVDPSPIRGVEALSLLARLTRESWSLAGLVEPSYTRAQIPCRCVPGHVR